MKRNPGHLPEEAAGKRVRVRLAHGRIGATDDNPMSPPGWAADGQGGCRWTHTGSPFDIAEYEVIA
ncbi:conserved hypothetical protein [Sphingomonas aurantiaca]|uniref:Uncharacterized protein n=1 Tax=Sphingomonas aurantiaca TaxID=185949 RepID=A0A5E7ZMZ3_9SPHN|nr:conserved hypothetical protein [Sphingomonas aurantiaca]